MNWACGGIITFSVRTVFDGLPGAVQHSTRVALPATVLNLPDRRGVGGPNSQVQAGDHWLVFEGSLGAGCWLADDGALDPLAGYASSPGVLGTEWMHADTLDFSVRVNSASEPPPMPDVPGPGSRLLLVGGLTVLAIAAMRQRRRARFARAPLAECPANDSRSQT